MKTQIRFLVFLLCVAGLSLAGARPSLASTTSTVYSEDFSGGSIPDGWDNSTYSWNYSASGNGDYNGSLVCDMYDYYFGGDPIVSPTIDASRWSNSSDEAYLDFDFFWEYNDYAAMFGDDNFQVLVTNSSGSQQVLSLSTSTAYTYNDADGSYSVLFDPLTSSDNWAHYHIAIPAAFRTSDLRIQFQGNPNWGASNPAIDNVVISGTHFNSLGVTPATSINFGSVSIEDTEYRTVILSNPNPVAITISNVNVVGSAFGLAYAATTIAPGTQANPTLDSIVVMFTPTVGGSQAGTLTFNTDADNPANVSLTLQGTGIAPNLAVGSQTLFNKSHIKLGQSVTQSVTVSNSGPAHLIILPSTHLAGDYPSEYSLVRVPSERLSNGDMDSITVVYHPTLEGMHSALLYIESNGGEQIVQLRGVGILPHISVTPSSFDFPATPIGNQVSQNFTVSNPGTDTLVLVRNYFASADYDFSYTGLSTRQKLAPGQSAQFTVTFAPLDRGTRLATVRLTTNIPPTFSDPSIDTSSVDVYVTGVGIPVGILTANFPQPDSAIVGISDTRTGSLTNNGSESLTINSLIPVSGNTSDFSISGQTFPLTIAANSTVPITVSFTPSARGVRTMGVQANVTTNDITENIPFSISDVGLQVCANASQDVLFNANKILAGTTDTEIVTITNCGDVATTYNAAITGVTGPYTVTPAISPVVMPGGNTTFKVVFAPTDFSQSIASLTVSGGTGVTPMVVNLMGSGEGVAAAANGAAGTVAVGKTKTFTVTVTNNGNMDWTPGAASITGTNANDFVVATQVTPSTISAGNSGTLTINFTPTIAASETATLTFPSASPSPMPAFNFTLNGVGANSGVSEVTTEEGFSLKQNYPNPANNATTISFSLPYDASVHVSIADQKGTMLKMIANGRFGAGDHDLTFDVNSLSSGSYYCIFESNGIRLIRELEVVK